MAGFVNGYRRGQAAHSLDLNLHEFTAQTDWPWPRKPRRAVAVSPRGVGKSRHGACVTRGPTQRIAGARAWAGFHFDERSN